MVAKIPYGEIPDPNNTIAVKLAGGLGNVLFQYMAGLATANRLGVPLYCATDKAVMHGSALELVGIHPTYIDLPAKLLRRSEKRKDRSLGDRFKSLTNSWPLRPIREPHFHYWTGFENVTAGTLLSGYWQSARYFETIADQLNNIIKLDEIRAGIDGSVLKDISQFKSASVHIRRGDFLNDPASLVVHGIIEKDYYDRARAHLEKTVKPDVFYVFSDDTEKARGELGHWSNTVFMEKRKQEQDLAMMAHCDHHIIANSSFSWWGAMLNTNEDKTVITPKNWFSEEALKTRNIKDLIPDDWISL